jgi:hypothetical protein
LETHDLAEGLADIELVGNDRSNVTIRLRIPLYKMENS